MNIKTALEIVHRVADTCQIPDTETADALETVKRFIDQCDSWLPVLVTTHNWSDVDYHYDDGKHHGS